MDVYRAVVTKRDTRTFTSDPVSEGDLRKVLQAGRMAGSAKNEQLNRMVVVNDEEQRKQLAGCGKFADWVARVPVAIAIVVPAEKGRLVDVGRMIQNMMITANGLGLASCPFTLHDQDCAREVLGLPPEYEAPMGVGLGHPGPKDPNRDPSPRLPLEEYVRWGQWDNSWDDSGDSSQDSSG